MVSLLEEEEVVDVKRTYAAVLLTFVRLSKSRSWSSDVACMAFHRNVPRPWRMRMRDTRPGSQL